MNHNGLPIDELQRVVINALEEVKGQQIQAFDTRRSSDLFDRVVIASGTSNRQTRALAFSVVEDVKKAGGRIVSIEGDETGEWLLVDCGDLVCHIMQPAVRSYYNLEELWGQYPIELYPKPAKKVAAKKATAQKKVSAKTPAGKKEAQKKSTASKTVVKKTAGKKVAAKKIAVTKTAAKKPALKKSATKA